MKRIFFLSFILLLSVVGCSGGGSASSPEPSDPSNPNPPTPPADTTTIKHDFVVSSYVRGNFYNQGRVSVESMQACNDLVVIGATPNADGSLTLETFNGDGVSTLAELVDSVSSAVSGGGVTVRLGIQGGGEWKSMVANETAYKAFAQNVSQLVSGLSLSGVDLDFEWAETSQEFANYADAVIELRSVLGRGKLLSVALHPLYYQMPLEAINVVDYAFLQCYGPLPVRFSYSEFMSNISTVISYGVPASKLVPGVPFYGVATDGSKATVAYYALVESGAVTAASQNEATYNGVQYTFNGQDVIAQKSAYAVTQKLAGVMSWDLATDVPLSNTLSLLQAMTESIAKTQ